MNYRECVNCGAENELLVSNCAYCGSSIIQDEFVEQESDELEDLIQDCGMWIARFEGMVSDMNTLSSAKQMDSMRSTPIFGAVFAHILADLIASYLDPHIRGMILGIVIGGLLPLAFIPFLEILIKKKNKHHIVTGDHEDVKKDLDTH